MIRAALAVVALAVAAAICTHMAVVAALCNDDAGEWPEERFHV